MIKRPLLFGVLAFVIGEIAGLNPYMAMGLGMADILFLLWYILSQGGTHRRWEDALRPTCASARFTFLSQGGTQRSWEDALRPACASAHFKRMPFFVLSFCICVLLGILNGCRCRIPDPVHAYMEQNGGEPISCMAEGRVKRIEYRDGMRILILRTTQIKQEERLWNHPYTIKLYEEPDSFVTEEGTAPEADRSLCVGNQIRCEVRLVLPSTPTNPGEFDGNSYYQARGIDFLGFTDAIMRTDDSRNPVLQRITELRQQAQDIFYQSISEENAGVMGAMILGNTGELDSGIRKLYQRNGIAHILAISALHISIIGGTLYRLLRKLGCSYMGAGIPVITILILYGWMTGFSGSAIRAVIMFGIMLAGDILGRTYDMLTAVGISCLCILVENPCRLWDAGFLLSFGAVLSLGIVVPALQEYMEPVRKGRLRRYLADSLCSGMVLQIMTGPIVAYFYYDVPIYGVFLNMIVIPLMTLLVVCGCSALLLYPLFPWLGSMVVLPCEWILNLFRSLCEAAERLPGAVWHVGAVSLPDIGIYYGSLVLLYVLWKHKKKIPAMLTVMLLGCYGLFPCKGPLVITMLDIGQGDSILMETPNHQYILLDGGSSSRSSIGEYVITPAVKYYGSGCLDYVFLSHMDQDHVNGIIELIGLSKEGGIQIRYLILPESAESQEAFRDLIMQAEEAGIVVTTMNRGESLVLDSLSITCLYPEYLPEDEGRSSSGTEHSKNNDSMVLSLSYGAFDMLFTGDLEAEGEGVLLEEAQEMLRQSYDVLKVGHHGSATSSSMAFLERLQPDFALISCGRNNSYGHPHAETLERIEAAGGQILCTVQTGAIEIRTDGTEMEFHFYNADHQGL